MGEVEQWLPDETFTPPDLSALGGAETTVPSVAGQPLSSARRILEDAGFSVLVGTEAYSEYPEGTVAYSDPGSGAVHAAGLRRSIYPSTGFVPAPQPTNPQGGGDDDGGGGDRRRRQRRRRQRRWRTTAAAATTGAATAMATAAAGRAERAAPQAAELAAYLRSDDRRRRHGP